MPVISDVEDLKGSLPTASFPVIARWLHSAPVQLRITAPRTTKLGDFRAASGSMPHRISVNGDLNKYAFLVTLVHEFAHFTAFTGYRRRIEPHGKEWKAEYARLMRPFLNREVFPADILEALRTHLKDAPASSCSDHTLLRVLRKYDRHPGKRFLEDLPHKAIFQLNGRTFIKGERLRKRYQCTCLNDRKPYFVDPLAEVFPTNKRAAMREAKLTQSHR